MRLDTTRSSGVRKMVFQIGVIVQVDTLALQVFKTIVYRLGITETAECDNGIVLVGKRNPILRGQPMLGTR